MSEIDILLERLQAKSDWFLGKYTLDVPEEKRPPYESCAVLLPEAIAAIKHLRG